MYQQRGNDALAARYYLEALRWDSTLAESHNNLGLLLHKKGELDKAIEQYERAVRFAPESGFYSSNLGSAYLQTDRLDLARTTAERAIAQDSTLTSALVLLGEIQLREGNIAQAISQWETAATKGANSEKLRAKIADAQQRRAAQKQ